jgi:hypothetical protein
MDDDVWVAERVLRSVPHPSSVWHPTLQMGGAAFSLPVSLATEEECLEWMRDHIAGTPVEGVSSE